MDFLEHDAFRVHRSAGRVAVFGDVDELSVDTLREVLGRYDSALALTVDLSGVTYLASAAISVLVATHLRLRSGGGLRLVARRPSVAQQVLDICGIPHDEE